MARLGGDEFVIVATDTTAPSVTQIIGRVRDALAADPTAPPGLSVSVGIAERKASDERPLDDLVDEADRDMYQQRMLRRLRSHRKPAEA